LGLLNQSEFFRILLNSRGKIPIFDSLLETSTSIEGVSPSGILVKVVIFGVSNPQHRVMISFTHRKQSVSLAGLAWPRCPTTDLDWDIHMTMIFANGFFPFHLRGML
jgi:hypothetical protein